MKFAKRLLSLLLCFVIMLGSVAVGGGGFAEALDELTIKASAEHYSAEKYKIVLCDDYGEFETFYFYEGETIPNSIFTEYEITGYSFVGWKDETNTILTVMGENNFPQTMPARDLRFTAVYIANTYYTLTFNAGDGIFADGTGTKTCSIRFRDTIPQSICECEPIPPRKCVFVGWTMGWTVDWRVISLPFTMPANDLELYAVYEDEDTFHTSPSNGDYKITLDANGGKFSNGVSNKIYYYNAGETISHIEKPTNSNYQFYGWSDIFQAKMPAKDISYSAVWSVTGKFEQYTTGVILNSGKSYISDITVDGKIYETASDKAITISEAKSILNHNIVVCLQNDKVVKLARPAENDTSVLPSLNIYDRGVTSAENDYADFIWSDFNAFKSYMDDYYDTFKTFFSANTTDVKKLAKKLQNEGNYFADFSVIDVDGDIDFARYYALAKFLTDVVQKNQFSISTKGKSNPNQAAIDIIKAVYKTIIGYHSYSYEDYDISFNVIGFSTSFTGTYEVKNAKTSAVAANGEITSPIGDVQNDIADYITTLGDLVDAECCEAISQMFSEFLSATGIAEATDEKFTDFFTARIQEKLESNGLFKNVYKIFIGIRAFYRKYKEVSSIVKKDGFLEFDKWLSRGASSIETNAEYLYEEIKDIDFPLFAGSNRSAKNALENLKAARKDLLKHLKKYISNSITGKTDNDTLGEKIKSWFQGGHELITGEKISCPVEFKVYDLNDNLLGYVDGSSEHEDYVNYSDEIYIEVSGNSKYIYHPADIGVIIKTSAYDYGDMTFSVMQYENEEMTSAVNFYDARLSLENGFEIIVPADINLAEESADISNIASELKTPAESICVDDAENIITVDCMCSDGIVYGYGQYLKGTEVELTASADEGYEFISWVVNDEEVSRNIRYTFTAKEDVKVVAVFQKSVISSNPYTPQVSSIALAGDGYSEIKAGKTLCLAVHINNPHGYKVVWETNSECVTLDGSYMNCEIIGVSSGKAKITVKLVDNNGNTVCKDSITVKVKPNLHLKINAGGNGTHKLKGMIAFFLDIYAYILKECFPIFSLFEQ